MSIFQPSTSAGWVPFSEDITDRLNEEKAWCFVCNEDVVRERYPSYTPAQINSAINSSFLVLSGIFDSISSESKKNPPLPSSSNEEGGEDPSTLWRDPLDARHCLGRVLVTTPKDCETYYECSAVWGQPIMLALVDMPIDATFVCDFRWIMKLVEYFLDNTPHTQQPSPQHAQEHLPPGLLPQALQETRAGVVSFINQVMRGQYPKALQGKKPCPIHAPPTAMGMCTALQGVSCTYRPLVYDPFCDVVTGVFSKRCPCCPDVMYMLDYVVRHINVHRTRFEHEPERDPYWKGTKCVYSATSSLQPTTTFPEDSAAAIANDATYNNTAAAEVEKLEIQPAVLSHTSTGKICSRLRLVILNIEENDLGPQDWPTAEEEQIVPHIRIYPACVRRDELHSTTGMPLSHLSPDNNNNNRHQKPSSVDNSIVDDSVSSSLKDRTAVCDHCGVSVPMFRPDGTVERDTRLVGNKVSHIFTGTDRTPEHLLQFILNHILLTKLDADGVQRVLAQFKKCSEKRARASLETDEASHSPAKTGPKTEKLIPSLIA